MLQELQSKSLRLSLRQMGGPSAVRDPVGDSLRGCEAGFCNSDRWGEL